MPKDVRGTGRPGSKEVVSVAGYKLINQIAEVEIPPNTGDFRLLSRRVVDEINRLKECHGFFRGMVALVGFRQTSVLFDRPPRFSGKGNYNRFLGSLRIGFNGIFCFSNRALGLSTQIGFIIAFSRISDRADIRRIETHSATRFRSAIPTIVLLVLFLGGIQLVSIGILGEYIGRIYEEVRQRPRFIVDEAFGLDISRTAVPRRNQGIEREPDKRVGSG